MKTKKAVIDLFSYEEETNLAAVSSREVGDSGYVKRNDEIHILDAQGNPVALVAWHQVDHRPRIVAMHGIEVHRREIVKKSVKFPYEESRNKGAGIVKEDVFDPKMEDIANNE